MITTNISRSRAMSYLTEHREDEVQDFLSWLDEQ